MGVASPLAGSDRPPPQPFCLCMAPNWALLDTRLLYAGQPLQPSAPPVPLQRPPPGQVPVGVCSADTYVAPMILGVGLDPDAELPLLGVGRGAPEATTPGGFLRLVGRDVFLALRYSPQALHIVAPWGDRLHRGVRVVPQLLLRRVNHRQQHGGTRSTWLTCRLARPGQSCFLRGPRRLRTRDWGPGTSQYPH